MVKRGFSLVELLFVIVVSTIVMGATVSLYGYTMTRLAQANARFTTENQARILLDDIELVVMDSVHVATIASANGPALKCTLAQTSRRRTEFSGSGSDSAGSKTAEPTGTTKRGFGKYGIGKRVWFYRAGPTGAFGTAGTYIWRAERNDDSNPTASDVVVNWAGYFGVTEPRFPLVTALGFTVDATNSTVTASASSRTLWRSETQCAASERDSQTYTESRTVGWRHWFR